MEQLFMKICGNSQRLNFSVHMRIYNNGNRESTYLKRYVQTSYRRAPHRWFVFIFIRLIPFHWPAIAVFNELPSVKLEFHKKSWSIHNRTHYYRLIGYYQLANRVLYLSTNPCPIVSVPRSLRMLLRLSHNFPLHTPMNTGSVLKKLCLWFIVLSMEANSISMHLSVLLARKPSTNALVLISTIIPFWAAESKMFLRIIEVKD